jgi:hypothetical protein
MEHTEESSLLSESNKKFFVFHDWGVSVYEPQNCRLLHMIQSTDIMPGTQVSTRYTPTYNALATITVGNQVTV